MRLLKRHDHVLGYDAGAISEVLVILTTDEPRRTRRPRRSRIAVQPSDQGDTPAEPVALPTKISAESKFAGPATSPAHTVASGPEIASSVEQPSDQERLRAARNRSVATVLSKLGGAADPADLGDVLIVHPDPTMRMGAAQILDELHTEEARRILVLGLGDFDESVAEVVRASLDSWTRSFQPSRRRGR